CNSSLIGPPEFWQDQRLFRYCPVLRHSVGCRGRTWYIPVPGNAIPLPQQFRSCLPGTDRSSCNSETELTSTDSRSPRRVSIIARATLSPMISSPVGG